MNRLAADGFRKMTPWCRKSPFFRISSTLLLVLPLLSGAAPFEATGQELPAAGTKMTVRLGKVIDGDSLMVKNNTQELEIRLFGIDAPEFKQPGAKAAKLALTGLAKSDTLQIEVVDHDRYGRVVAHVVAGTVNVAGELVRSGHAWVYPRYCRQKVCETWQELQAQAREQQRGFWKQREPLPPWQWKRRHRTGS